MTGCISGNHGLWECNKRLRDSKNVFTSRRSFCESARHLRYSFVNLLSFQGQVRMLLMRVAELEKRNLPVSN
ncbi:hypothetical protein YC2023_054748 [Brassica napus]